MKIRNIIIILLALLNWACKNKTVQLRAPSLENELEQFIGTYITLPEFIPQNVSDFFDYNDFKGKKYKMIFYVDSSACGECIIKSLIPLDDYLRQHKEFVPNILVIFNTQNLSTLKSLMTADEINFTYFIDTENKFRNQNPSFPCNRILHTFLLKNHRVILAGNPLNNDKLKGLYQKMTCNNY